MIAAWANYEVRERKKEKEGGREREREREREWGGGGGGAGKVQGIQKAFSHSYHILIRSILLMPSLWTWSNTKVHNKREKRVLNTSIPYVEYVWRVTYLECQ